MKKLLASVLRMDPRMLDANYWRASHDKEIITNVTGSKTPIFKPSADTPLTVFIYQGTIQQTPVYDFEKKSLAIADPFNKEQSTGKVSGQSIMMAWQFKELPQIVHGKFKTWIVIKMLRWQIGKIPASRSEYVNLPTFADVPPPPQK